MTLFGIGPGELVLIFVLALIIFGPQRLPEVARTIGKAINDFRKTSEEVTTAVARELDVSDAVGTESATAPAVRPIHSIPLSKVGEVVSPETPPRAEPTSPEAAPAPAEWAEDADEPDEGSRAQHD